MGDRIGQQLGNYRLLRLLGQGGFAQVYLGEHIYLETPAAIKLLTTRLTQDETDPFRREARTIARLIHPYIVRVLEYGLENEIPYLVMDYAPNGTLRKRHPRGVPLSLPTAITYVNHLADALQYAHDQKVIHRDVKPENVLIGRRNETLLSDFGIALVTQTTHMNSTQDMQSNLAGTIAYMAPEQIQSKSVPASDQYALAIMAYEWLSGERPFQGNFTEIAVKQTLTPPPSLREKVPEIAPGIEAAIMRGLEKDPEKRFPSINDFAHALEQGYLDAGNSPLAPASTLILSSQETLADSPTPVISLENETSPVELNNETTPIELNTADLPEEQVTSENKELVGEPLIPAEAVTGQPSVQESSVTTEAPPLQRRVSRRALIGGGIGLVALTAVGGGIGLLQQTLSGNQRSDSQLVPTSEISTLGTYSGHKDWIWSVRWSPNGQYLASTSSDKTVQVWDSQRYQTIYIYTGHRDSVYTAAWSPDSQRLASAGYDTQVKAWNALNGQYPTNYNGHRGPVWTAAWSPDGRSLASAGEDHTVRVWNSDTHDTGLIYRGHQAAIYTLCWSPDGRYLASGGQDKQVQVWNALTGQKVYVYQPYSTTIWSISWAADGKRIASGGDDQTVQVWRAETGDLLGTYKGHKDSVRTLSWSPDGKRIASGSRDATVQVWSAPTTTLS